ncbi:HPP family protein [Hoeflea sp.]|uniref:HPP family protein n=1 Tax=Hoeflea sp. TaxID=1940281 RepID=UPI0019A109DC|nr:HPP family protein [Hoeflea sp.]MBC7281602.1 HPP family protein [Hoeflea sp.]
MVSRHRLQLICSFLGRRLARLRSFGPVIGPTKTRDTAAGAAGAGLALLMCTVLIIGAGVDLSYGAFLIAPMGATTVILFALPNSPLAQPWSAIVGNTVSALVALGVHQATRDPALAIGASACLSLAAMFMTRSLHPPGGAVALTASLDPAMLDTLGLIFVLIPVFLGTVVLVALAMLWHQLNGRVYPFRQPKAVGPHATADKAPQQRLGLEPEELARILADYRQSANLGVEDLARLIAAAEQVAASHALGAMTCDAIMSRDLVTVRPDVRAAQVADLFRKHGFTSIPVVEKGGVLLGVIFQLDLIRRARRDSMRANTSFGAGMAAIRRERSVGIIRASEIMTTGLPTVVATTPVASLMPLLADGGAEAVPVMQGDRIVGIATRTDLLSAFVRSTAREVQ